MRYTKDAIKYAIETLNITPKALLTLIESSKDYDGTDYNRWLAAQVIKIAEKDEVGYTLLMAKWFNIIQSLSEEYSDDNIKPVWLDYIKGLLGDGLVCGVGLEHPEELGVLDLSDVDWYKGLDILWNPLFIENELPKEVSKALLNGEKVTIFAKFNSKSNFGSSNELAHSAKSEGLVCKSAGSLLVYRLCTMVQALEDKLSNLKFVFMTNTDFLYSRENGDIIKYFLQYFNYEGCVVSSKELYQGSYTSEEYAICTCTPRTFDKECQDGFLLPRGIVMKEGVEYSTSKNRYSAGSIDNDLLTVGKPESVKAIDKDYKVVGEVLTIRGIGYACKLPTEKHFALYTLPLFGSEIKPITMSNLAFFIAYYGVTKSLESLGMSSNIPSLITGHSEFLTIMYNSLPIMLFDYDNRMSNIYGVAENRLAWNSELVESFFDDGAMYLGFEAKQLIDICTSYDLDSHSGLSFNEIREKYGSASLNSRYTDALAKCKEYIASLYRTTMG